MAFLQPPASQQPAFNIPLSVGVLLIAFIAVHVVRSLIAPELSGEIVARYAFNPALYSPAFLASHHLAAPALWQLAISFVSHIFLHADLTHLAINCLFLLAFGPVVARRFGAPLFFLFFFASAIVAAVVHLVVYWGADGLALGASGAIAGLLGAAMRMLSLQDPRVDLDAPLLPLTSSRVILVSVIWILMNVAGGLAGFTGVGTTLRLVAWQAHIGGYVFGLLASGVFDHLARRDEPAPG